MGLILGDIISIGTDGDFISGTEPDWPAEGDVRVATEYDNGNFTGLLDCPAEGDVKDGVVYDNETKVGAYGISSEIIISGLGTENLLHLWHFNGAWIADFNKW